MQCDTMTTFRMHMNEVHNMDFHICQSIMIIGDEVAANILHQVTSTNCPRMCSELFM